MSGRFHYFRGIVKVQDDDASDVAVFEQLLTEAGLGWNDYSAEEASAVLGSGYALGSLDIEDKSAHLRWTEPLATPEVLAEAEEAFRVWADGRGYEPWFGESE